jgi:HAL2 family 3'(2'),5'-bisphosphate nucleotidase
MTIQFNDPHIQFAIDAVRQASLLIKHIQAELASQAAVKNDRSPVTVADFSAQALVGMLLERHLPGESLIGEESSGMLADPANRGIAEQTRHYISQVVPGARMDQVLTWIDRGAAEPGSSFWTLDPLDGTLGFLRGDQYAVALAYVQDGVVQVGALGCPNLRDACIEDHAGPGTLIVAQRGRGTWTTTLAGSNEYCRLSVSAIDDGSKARLVRSVEKAHTNASQVALLAEALGTSQLPVLMDSQAKYALLAAGAGDAVLRLLSKDRPSYKEKIWDQAAGSLVVEEAGGKITDLDGKRLDFRHGRTLTQNRGVVASNGRLHEAILQAVKRIEMPGLGNPKSALP